MQDIIHPISATKAAREFSDVLNRVAYQHETLEISRGGRAVARLTPVPANRGVKLSELNTILQGLPGLGEDIESFAKDIEEAGNQSFDDPWT